MGLPDTCERCGTVAGGSSAFVDYTPDPNDSQAETEWGADLPRLLAVVCMDCGYIHGVFDPDDLEDGDSTGSEFKIERELR